MPDLEGLSPTWPNQADGVQERAGPGRGELHQVDEDREGGRRLEALKQGYDTKRVTWKPGMVQRTNRVSRNTNPKLAGRSFSIEQPS